MPHFCGCIAPCNCLVEEDGFFANRPQDGRRNTVVTGSGTVVDPLIFQFQNSEFYRAPAGELKANNVALNSGGSRVVHPKNGDIIVSVYETPGQVFIPVPNSDAIATMRQRYHIAGAAAKFATNATGLRRLALVSSPADLTVLTDNLVIGGQTSLGSATNNIYLSCSGFSPGLHVVPQTLGISNTRFNLWGIVIQQDSGVPLILEYVKFWAVTI